MAKKEKKSKIKITEIPSKIKAIKVIGKSESELEKEVEESNAKPDEFKDFAPSGNFQVPILKSDSPQEVSERPVTVEQTRTDSEFSQTRIYATAGQQSTTSSESGTKYITQAEINRRFNPSIEKNDVRIDLSQPGPDPEFVSSELKMLRGQEKESGYVSPRDIQGERSKRKYPWEI